MEQELSATQAGFRKGRGTRDQIANLRWIMETAIEYQTKLYICFIDYTRVFDCVDHELCKIQRTRSKLGLCFSTREL